MADRRFFRFVLACDAGLMAAHTIWPPLVPASDVATSADGSGAALLLALPLAIGTVVSLVGLWRFWPPARPLYVAVLIAAIVFVAIWSVEPTLASGPEHAITSLNMVVAGMVVALMYYSPVKTEFERRAPVV